MEGEKMKNTKWTDRATVKQKVYEGDLHERIHRVVMSWPDWKKQEYNDNFAVSCFSEKLDIRKNKKEL